MSHQASRTRSCASLGLCAPSPLSPPTPSPSPHDAMTLVALYRRCKQKVLAWRLRFLAGARDAGDEQWNTPDLTNQLAVSFRGTNSWAYPRALKNGIGGGG